MRLVKSPPSQNSKNILPISTPFSSKSFAVPCPFSIYTSLYIFTACFVPVPAISFNHFASSFNPLDFFHCCLTTTMFGFLSVSWCSHSPTIPYPPNPSTFVPRQPSPRRFVHFGSVVSQAALSSGVPFKGFLLMSGPHAGSRAMDFSRSPGERYFMDSSRVESLFAFHAISGSAVFLGRLSGAGVKSPVLGVLASEFMGVGLLYGVDAFVASGVEYIEGAPRAGVVVLVSPRAEGSGVGTPQVTFFGLGFRG
jgi:hypothetical protein